MSKEDKIRKILGADGGMKVPDGFFDMQFAKIQAELPPYPEIPLPVKLSFWHRVRPYVYMAAMFAGIWLMMQLFHNVSSPSLSLDNIPDNVASAMISPDVALLPDNSLSVVAEDAEISADMLDRYDDIEEFVSDFGYKLDPSYSNIKIPESCL